MKNSFKYFLFAFFLIIIDQLIKLWMHFDVVPNHFGVIELIPNVFHLHYVLNKGMAFGLELGGDHGKLALSLFRLIAMFAIAYYLVNLSAKKTHQGLLWSIASILAGAIGNLIDSIFYGVWLDNAPVGSSTPWFHGQVIDMFYAKFLDGYWPDWIPFLGGQYNSTPIFNFADACIFCGVVTILIFQNKFIDQPEEKEELIENESYLNDIDENGSN